MIDNMNDEFEKWRGKQDEKQLVKCQNVFKQQRKAKAASKVKIQFQSGSFHTVI